MVYNSFPKMADKWIPEDILAFKPKLANFTENPTTVQFDHRILGTTTLGVITYLWYLSRKRILPPRAYKAVAAVGILAYLQVIDVVSIKIKQFFKSKIVVGFSRHSDTPNVRTH